MNLPPVFVAGVFGLGGPELIVILVIMLVLFGGAKLPELAKGLGKSIKEFKRASSDTDESVREPVKSETRPADAKSK